MPDSPLWKYYTPAHHREFLLSLGLLEQTGWPPARQLACLYALANHSEDHYRQLRLPKRDGGWRVLQEPDPLLKSIQRRILHCLLDGRPLAPQATAYHAGADILHNARPHLRQPLLLKLDIEDFFGSITFPMVYQAAFPRTVYPPAVAGLLTHLCCYQDVLPQGAPTSAAISNLVLLPFDRHLSSWCAERGITYTRYCDDMAFSGDFAPRSVIAKARHYLEALGFRLNDGKTRLYHQGQRQTVTGLVVNDKPQTTREYRRSLRQDIYYCCRYGVASHLARQGLDMEPARYLASLCGRVNHVLHVNPEDTAFQQAKIELQALIEKEHR